MPEGLRGAFGPAEAESGRQPFITPLRHRRAIEAVEPIFEQMGGEIPEETRGRRVSMDYYERESSVQLSVGLI